MNAQLRSISGRFENSGALESVAAYVHKTPAYISRVFKNELGCKPDTSFLNFQFQPAA